MVGQVNIPALILGQLTWLRVVLLELRWSCQPPASVGSTGYILSVSSWKCHIRRLDGCEDTAPPPHPFPPSQWCPSSHAPPFQLSWREKNIVDVADSYYQLVTASFFNVTCYLNMNYGYMIYGLEAGRVRWLVANPASLWLHTCRRTRPHTCFQFFARPRCLPSGGAVHSKWRIAKNHSTAFPNFFRT